MVFVFVGLQTRMNLLQGQMQTAKQMLSSFTRLVQERGDFQLLPNTANGFLSYYRIW